MVKSWLFASLAASAAVPLAAADLTEIRERGVLRVLVAADEMEEMYRFDDEGDPGLEREMVEGFARSQGLSVEVVRIERFDTIIPALLDGRGDLITGIIATEERRERVRFTVETLPARHIAVTRSPREPIASPEELAQLEVAVVTGTSWETAARDAGVPSDQRVGYATAQDALSALSSGEVPALVMSLTDFAHALRSDAELQAGCFVGAASSAGWAVRPDDGELLRALDDYLTALQGSPSWSGMVLRYFSEDALRLIARGRR